MLVLKMLNQKLLLLPAKEIIAAKTNPQNLKEQQYNN